METSTSTMTLTPQEQAYQAQLAALRTQILTQAAGDLIELAWELDPDDPSEDPTVWSYTSGRIMIPRAPFLHWAFARIHLYDRLLPPWTPISPPGMKMGGDDPFHTDWVIGGGLDPADYNLLYHPGPVNVAALMRAHELQNEFDRPAVHVLADGPWVTGLVIHGRPNRPVPPGRIVVVPNLRPHYLPALQTAAGVITEAGGVGAHLVQIGREGRVPIVRLPDARRLCPEGVRLSIDTATRTIIGS